MSSIFDSLVSAVFGSTPAAVGPVAAPAPSARVAALRADHARLAAEVTAADDAAKATAEALARAAADSETAARVEADAAALVTQLVEEGASDADVDDAQRAHARASLRRAPVDRRRADAEAAHEAAVAAVSSATTAAIHAEAAIEMAALEERADLGAFRQRQTKRAARMLELVVELKTLAVESDADFFETNDVAREAGLTPLDVFHLVDGLASAGWPIGNLDEAKRIRNAVKECAKLRAALVPHVARFFTDLSRRDWPLADSTFDLEALRAARTFAEYQQGDDERKVEAIRLEAERRENDPEVVAARDRHNDEQADLARAWRGTAAR